MAALATYRFGLSTLAPTCRSGPVHSYQSVFAPRDDLSKPTVRNRTTLPDFTLVDDPEDPRIAEYVDLTDPELRIATERDGGFFIAESPHVIETVLRANKPVRSVLITPHQREALAPMLATVTAPVFVAPPTVLRRVVGFDLHRGAVASVTRWPPPPLDSVLAGATRIAVVEGINDHENLGGLFRNAAAFGVDAVLLDEHCADPLYRRSVRVSIGHVCTVPWTRYAHVDDIRNADFTLYALTPAADAVAIDTVAWAERAAVMVGAEGPGLSAASLAAADQRVRIPMAPGVDSLNIATAAAIAFHCFRR